MSVRGIYRGSTQTGKPTGSNAPIRVDPTSQALVLVPGGPGATAEVGANGLEVSPGTVTQATNITTGVTLNARRGKITTVTAPAIAAGAEAEFTLTNSYIGVNSVIALSMDDQFTDGVVIPYVKSQAAGSAVIGLTNVSAAAVSAGTAIINFAVL